MGWHRPGRGGGRRARSSPGSACRVPRVSRRSLPEHCGRILRTRHRRRACSPIRGPGSSVRRLWRRQIRDHTPAQLRSQTRARNVRGRIYQIGAFFGDDRNGGLDADLDHRRARRYRQPRPRAHQRITPQLHTVRDVSTSAPLSGLGHLSAAVAGSLPSTGRGTSPLCATATSFLIPGTDHPSSTVPDHEVDHGVFRPENCR